MNTIAEGFEVGRAARGGDERRTRGREWAGVLPGGAASLRTARGDHLRRGGGAAGAAQRAPSFRSRPADRCAIVDIGGGSMEVTLTAGAVVDEVLDAAARRRAADGDATAAMMRSRPSAGGGCGARIDRALDERLRKPPFHPEIMIGSGGTFTNLAAMAAVRARGNERSRAGLRDDARGRRAPAAPPPRDDARRAARNARGSTRNAPTSSSPAPPRSPASRSGSARNRSS